MFLSEPSLACYSFIILVCYSHLNKSQRFIVNHQAFYLELIGLDHDVHFKVAQNAVSHPLNPFLFDFLRTSKIVVASLTGVIGSVLFGFASDKVGVWNMLVIVSAFLAILIFGMSTMLVYSITSLAPPDSDIYSFVLFIPVITKRLSSLFPFSTASLWPHVRTILYYPHHWQDLSPLHRVLADGNGTCVAR